MTNNNEPSPMTKFSDDLILNIFKYLDICHLIEVIPSVCPRWNKMAHTKKLWVNPLYVDFPNPTSMIRILASETWRECTRHLETFVFKSKTSREVDYLLKALAIRCLGLRKIDMREQKVDFPDSNETIFHSGSFLEVLNLEGTNRINRHIVRDTAFSFFDDTAKLTRLRALYINHCNWTDKEFVEALLDSEQKLAHLSIKSNSRSVASVMKLVQKHASQLKELTISGILSNELLETISNISTLHSLTLNQDQDDFVPYLQLQFSDPAVVLTEQGWNSFGNNFAALRHLNLTGHTCLCASVVERIVAMCPGLQSISIVDCIRVTENIIEEVVRKCVRLEKMEIINNC